VFLVSFLVSFLLVFLWFWWLRLWLLQCVWRMSDRREHSVGALCA
jgi:hypothetical protein